ncbi:VWA domain-containing protein [Afifella sp. YEN Y35]|uniref:VWA domain-containing protein n=1 Tax=Afifella sp. YEN Y35 TaxID=3388337 RepID=UPI0039E1F247
MATSIQQDITFVIDTTGSMWEEIDTVKESVTSVIDAIFGSGTTDARVALVAYNDPDTEVVLNFTNDTSISARETAAREAIESLYASGGGDLPELVNAGLLHALDGDIGAWRPEAEARRIILFGDAPPKDTDLHDEVVSLANGQDVQIYGVIIGVSGSGIDSGTKEAFQDLASATGGGVIEAETTEDVVDSLLSVILTGTEPITGTSGDDALNGGIGFDTLIGGGGADTISGAGGSDQIFGGPGDDVEFGGSGNDVMFGGGEADKIWSGDGSDQAYGAAGNDVIGGGKGDDILGGGTGADSLYGGDGDDTVYGGSDASRDVIYGGSGSDVAYIGAGHDVLVGGADDDILGAGSGNDEVAGGAGADTIYGAAGDDTIFGGEDDDVIYGGSGNDEIYLGSDSYSYDVYAAGPNNGDDTVYGFEDGRDHIDLSETSIGSSAELDAALSTDASGNVVIAFAEGGSITIDGISAGEFSSSDVYF